MKNRLKRLGELLLAVFSGKIRLDFRLPAQCEVFILDDASEPELVLILLSNYRWFSLNIRQIEHGGAIFVHPTIIFRALAYLLRGYPLLTCYMLAVILVTKPRAVIDFCSQSNIVDLAQVNSDIAFISIINGMVSYPLDHSLYAPTIHQALGAKNIKNVNNYSIYCFGQRDVDIFSYFGVSEPKTGIKVYSAGSLLGSYYTEQIEPVNHAAKVDYDICLSSTTTPGLLLKQNDKLYYGIMMKCNDLLCDHLARFVKAHGLNLAIALRTQGETEFNYFRKWFGNDVQIAHREDIFSTYRVMRRSHLSISLGSTSGWEALAWKKKVMFTPFFDAKFFGYYAPGKLENNQEMWKWWLEDTGYEKFEAMLLDLLNMPDEEYWLQAHGMAEYGVAHWGVPAYRAIGDALKLAVGR